MRVAIDGPAGAGKSTVARLLAARLGFLLVDTGALYRSVALAAARAGIGWDEDARVGELAEALAGRAAIQLEPKPLVEGEEIGPLSAGPTSRVLLDGVDVSMAIRAPEMSLGASRVSANPRVRAALLAMQRRAGEERSVVLEGRDIGTVVFPDAEVKVFLTASDDERANRRMRELAGRGETVPHATVLAEIRERDTRDSSREVAPLRPAEGAFQLDSSRLTLDEVVAAIASRVPSA